MTERISRVAGAVVACAIAGVAGTASASAGSGIRFGGTDGRLHPFLDYETRYDSNVGYGAGNNALGDVIMHVRPGLEVKIPGDLAVVEFSGEVDWAQYLGMGKRPDGTTTSDLSRFYADAGVAALINPRGALSLRIDDDFRRQVSVTSLTFSSAVIANTNTLSLSLPWKPGGGALVLTLNGQWMLESLQPYDSGACPAGDVTCSSATIGDLGYNDFRTGIEAQWRFLPRTSAVFQGSFFTHIPNAKTVPIEDPISASPDTKTASVNGIDLLLGVTGLVTPHIGASLKAGFGQTYESRGNNSTFLADVGAEWIPTEQSSVRVGYSRGFGVDPLASVYVTNGVYTTGRMRALRRIAVSTTVRYDRLAFDDLDGSVGFLRVEPGVDVEVSKWMTATVGYAYTSRTSSFPDGLAIPSLGIDYSKSEGWLKLGFTY